MQKGNHEDHVIIMSSPDSADLDHDISAKDCNDQSGTLDEPKYFREILSRAKDVCNSYKEEFNIITDDELFDTKRSSHRAAFLLLITTEKLVIENCRLRAQVRQHMNAGLEYSAIRKW